MSPFSAFRVTLGGLRREQPNSIKKGLAMFRIRSRYAAALMAVVALSAVAHGQENLLKGCNFSEGVSAWGGMGKDDKKDVSVVDLAGGGKGLQLARMAEGQVAIDQT